MNQLSPIVAEPGTRRYVATRYDAFQISEAGRTYALDPLAAETLEEALNEVLARWSLNHKDHLLIRATGETVKLNLFAIKRKSQARYVYRDHVQHRVQDLYAAPVTTIDGAVL